MGHQNHVYGCRAWCTAVIGGGMRVVEMGHMVAWLWPAGAAAGDEKLVYFVALSQR